MKKNQLLNQPISAVIAGMGHMDQLVVADAGLPVPATTQRIDLALTRDVPRFIDALRVILSELQVERAVVAQEMVDVSPTVLRAIEGLLGNVPIEKVSHEEFKRRTATATAVVRTGEFTAYANIILIAGVVF